MLNILELFQFSPRFVCLIQNDIQLQMNMFAFVFQNGFDFHHAKAGFVMMARWLPTDLPANFPVFAHTMIGVGGLVVNDKDQILAITEKTAIIPGAWKLPGGYVEPGKCSISH